MEAEEQVLLNKEPLLSIAFPCSDTGPHTILASYSATPTSTLCLRPILRKVQGTPGLIKVLQEPRRSEELQPNPAVINQPCSKPNIFSPQGTAWSPVIPPKPELNDHRVDHEDIKQERSPSPSTSDTGEKLV